MPLFSIVFGLSLFGCQQQTDKPTPNDSGTDTLDTSEQLDSSILDTGSVLFDEIVPLFGPQTILEPETTFDRGDAIVTRVSDRGRDRHAREDEFQSYDHYLSRYWEYRTVQLQLIDTVAKGGQTIEVSFVSEWKLSIAEFRAWYLGVGTVATYSGNYAPQFQEDGPGTFDIDHTQLSNDGTQYRYSYTITSGYTLDGANVPLAVGQFMEIELSQFLANVPSGRANYYGTALLYEVGNGGMLPWEAIGSIGNSSSERENSVPLDESTWLGGRTTLPYMYSDEPDNQFMQMATNISSLNGQAFVLGRRVHHTDMLDGTHDESSENGTFPELSNLVGPNYINRSCDSCHTRNGRAAVEEIGKPLDKWVFKVADEAGNSDPLVGHVLQISNTEGMNEGSVSISEWETVDETLRTPLYEFTGGTPALYSARLAPQLVGMGLLEAIPEDTILALADPSDLDGDGISGRAQHSLDPLTNDIRLGRFGWKAGAGSLMHQVSAALNTDMGVMTSYLPTPDCGVEQLGCGNESGPEIEDKHLRDLVKYVALLGIRPRRDINDPQVTRGEGIFDEIGCVDCHRSELITGPYHPFSELRNQTIHPYTDLLLHDMGSGLEDTLGEGRASGSEWRTTPLWGLGLGPCVTGGVEGVFQQQNCTPDASYLHDGRARTIDEAIGWHGGEGEASRANYQLLSEADKEDLLKFLESL